MANSKRSFNAKKIITAIFGDSSGLALGVLFGFILLSWTADLLLELIKQATIGEFQFPFVWFAIIIILLFLGLFVALLFWARKNNQETSHTLEVVTPKPDQFKGLIGSLSFNSEKNFEKLDNDLKEAKQKQCTNLLEEKWLQKCNYYPLFKVLNENPSIESLVLLVSDKSFKQTALFYSLLKEIFPKVTLYVQQTSDEYPQPYSQQGCETGISFIQIKTLYQAYQTAYDFLNEKQTYEPKQILVDTTSGQVTNSIASAALIAERKEHIGVVMDAFSEEKALQYFNINAFSLN